MCRGSCRFAPLTVPYYLGDHLEYVISAPREIIFVMFCSEQDQKTKKTAFNFNIPVYLYMCRNASMIKKPKDCQRPLLLASAANAAQNFSFKNSPLDFAPPQALSLSKVATITHVNKTSSLCKIGGQQAKVRPSILFTTVAPKNARP